MITEDYVSFDTAKLLREKRFNGLCTAYYDCFTTDNFHSGCEPTDFNSIGTKIRNIVAAPTLQMAMKWLRKNHHIFIRPNTSFLYPIRWYSEIFCYGDNLKTQQDVKTEYYDSPEEACEAAIKYCLENLI